MIGFLERQNTVWLNNNRYGHFLCFSSEGERTQSFSGLVTTAENLDDFGDVKLDTVQVETEAIAKAVGGQIKKQRSSELNLR